MCHVEQSSREARQCEVGPTQGGEATVGQHCRANGMHAKKHLSLSALLCRLAKLHGPCSNPACGATESSRGQWCSGTVCRPW